MAGAGSLIIRGIIGIVVGIIAFAWPGMTITALVFLFGAYALLDGISSLAHGFANRSTGGHAWLVVVEGLIGIAAAIVTFAWPAITLFVLVILIGIWAIVTGIVELAAAIRLRRVISGEWLLAVSGVLSIGLGVFLFALPAAGAIVLAWWFGAYALATGIVLIALGLRLRHHLPA